MAVLNSSNVTIFVAGCPLTFDEEDIKKAGSIIDTDNVIIYFIYCPIIITFGIFGNTISIAAMWKQFKNEDVYLLQFLIVVADFIGCMLSLPYSIFLPLFTKCYVGPNWVKSSEVLSKYAGYFVSPMLNSFITCSLLLIALTSVDRLQVRKCLSV